MWIICFSSISLSVKIGMVSFLGCLFNQEWFCNRMFSFYVRACVHNSDFKRN
jgi:hypothetical protein